MQQLGRYSGIDSKPGNTGFREPDALTSSTYGDFNTTLTSRGVTLIKNVLGIAGGTDEEILTNYSQALVDEYNAMLDSMIKYKGFYIGRYELTGTVDAPTSKSGTVLTNQNWYSLKKVCNKLINNESVQSCMIYGWQWDATIEWIVRSGAKTSAEVNSDSTAWGNYSKYAIMTGLNEQYKVNNIYDLAGNYGELTQEAYRTDQRSCL